MPPSELFQAWLATHSNNARQRILDQWFSTYQWQILPSLSTTIITETHPIQLFQTISKSERRAACVPNCQAPPVVHVRLVENHCSGLL